VCLKGRTDVSLNPWVRPALLIVDMQNDFVRDGAPLEVPEARGTIPQHQELITLCRKAQFPIVYARYVVGPQTTLPEWGSKLEWALQVGPPVWACRRGHRRYYRDVDRTLECTDVIDEIYPKLGDYIIDKYAYSAFFQTNLNDILKSLGVESLLVTGTVTQVCVEESARQAFHHGYKTTIVSDAVSSRQPHRHAATLETFDGHYGWVAATNDVLRALGERLGVAPKA
jgi:nicotinamidase-related amidase